MCCHSFMCGSVQAYSLCVCVYEHVCVRELSRLSESIPGRYKLLTDDHY